VLLAGAASEPQRWLMVAPSSSVAPYAAVLDLGDPFQLGAWLPPPPALFQHPQATPHAHGAVLGGGFGVDGMAHPALLRLARSCPP
jgi:hypothetical protein